MITVVGGIKGGSGKTLISSNLAVLKSQEGKNVLLVDADEQHSASDWSNLRCSLGVPTSWTTIRLSGKYLNREVLKLKPAYDEVIIDCGGRDTTSQRSALSIANFFITPFRPRSVDIWTLADLKNMLDEILAFNIHLKSIAVINQADAQGTDNKDAQKAIEEYDALSCAPIHIGLRKSFANAMSDGLGITEVKKNTDTKAISEMQTLYKFIYEKHI